MGRTDHNSLRQEAAEYRDRAEKILEDSDGGLTAAQERECTRLIDRARELRQEAEEIEDDREARRERLASLERGETNGRTKMEDPIRSDGREVGTLRDKYGHEHLVVRGSANERAPLYEAVAERRGWPDRDEVEPMGEILARQVRGEQRAISESDVSGSIPAPALTAALDYLVNQTFLRRTGVPFVFPESDSLSVLRADSAGGLDWLAGGTTASSTDISFTSTGMSFGTYRGLIRVNREAVQDSVNAGDLIQRTLVSNLREELERAALLGSGSGEEPEGVLENSSVNEADFGGTTGGAAPESTGAGYPDFLQARERLLNDNIPDRGISHVMSPRLDRQLAELRDKNAQPVQAPARYQEIDKYISSAVSTTHSTGSLSGVERNVIGNWSESALVGVRLRPQVETYTGEKPGAYQLSILPVMRMGFVVTRPSGFERLNRITT